MNGRRSLESRRRARKDRNETAFNRSTLSPAGAYWPPSSPRTIPMPMMIDQKPALVTGAADRWTRLVSLPAAGLVMAALLLPIPAVAHSFYASALAETEAAGGIGAVSPASPDPAASFVERGRVAQGLELPRNLAGSQPPSAMREADGAPSFVERALMAQGRPGPGTGSSSGRPPSASTFPAGKTFDAPADDVE
jgi:hypothetical protein